jgi:outer membrane autotransporter protein
MGNAVYDAVASLSIDDPIPAAFDALSGEIHASLKTGLIGDSRYVRDAALARARTASGMSCLSPAGAASAVDDCKDDMPSPRYGAWTQAFGSFGSVDGDGNAAKLDTDTGGFMVGGDTAIGDAGLAGVLAGYQSSRYNVDARASKADANSFFLGVYGGADLNGVSLTGGATYAWAKPFSSPSRGWPMSPFPPMAIERTVGPRHCQLPLTPAT